ncbi:MAG TPA: hypothetical protein VFS44_12955 [Gemmatimonadaceae bacterium]|nr:hypothetical protein [Gemmatimonadaceae bacterium]
MQKLILVSILVAMLFLPMRAARDASAARGFRRAVVGFAVFVGLYVIAIVYVLPRLPGS